MFALLAVLLISVAGEGGVKNLIEQLSDRKATVRISALKKVLDMWESDEVLAGLRAALESSKAGGDAELSGRLEEIVSRLEFRRAAGAVIVGRLRDQIDKLYNEPSLAIEHVTKWLNSPKEVGIEDVSRQEWLLEFLYDKAGYNEEVKARVIGIIREKRIGRELLFKMLNDFSPSIREAAIAALAYLYPDAWHAAKIAQYSNDRSPQVRRTVIRSLVHLASKEHLDVMAAGLKDGDPYVNIEALDAMVVFGAAKYAASIAKLLGDPNPSVRQKAVETIAFLGLTDLAEAVAGKLKDDNSQVRSYAVRALVRLKASGSLDEIVRLLDDHDEEVVDDGIWAVGMLRGVKYREKIEQFLGHRNPKLIASAARSLARLGASDLAGKFADLLAFGVSKDKEPPKDAYLVRANACLALAELGACLPSRRSLDRQAADWLDEAARLLSDENNVVKGYAAIAVAMLATSGVEGLGDSARVEALRGLLASEDYFLKACAARALAELGDKTSAGIIQKELHAACFADSVTSPDMLSWFKVVAAQSLMELDTGKWRDDVSAMKSDSGCYHEDIVRDPADTDRLYGIVNVRDEVSEILSGKR